MNDADFAKVWSALDTRITSINDRTKAHTIEIKELQKEIKNLKEKQQWTKKIRNIGLKH
jgi:predicted  nucleic acid-binding Zn-ribbon protein